jgi:predicted nucleotidyltransferase
MDHILTYKDILDALRSERTFLKNEFGVINIGIFGSYVKGLQQDDSDIDFLVEFEKPSFNWTAGLQIYLEKKFNKKIELVRKSAKVNQRFAERIKGDVIYA